MSRSLSKNVAYQITAIWLSEWKQSNVTAVHKSGSYDDPSNYRLIYVVSIIAKILEKIVALHYCENQQLLTAYRHGRSTEQILLFVTNTIDQALDQHNIVYGGFLDLRKAFDSLDHVILLQWLNTLGVHETELLWFSY